MYLYQALQIFQGRKRRRDVYKRQDKGKIKPHIVKGLQPNTTYILHEISSPHGYALAQDVEFEIKDSGDLQFVEMKDELVLGQLVWEKTGEIFMSTVTGQCEFGKTESPVWETSNLLHAEITIYAAEDIKIGNTLYLSLIHILVKNNIVCCSI